MYKKSQITYFLLFSLIILIAGSFYFYINNQNLSEETEIEKSSKFQLDISPIKLYVENCIENTGKDALINIGRQGGYYELKKPYLIDGNFKLPYYVVENLDFSPSIDIIENEISKYISNNLPFCINNFEEFKKQGFNIEQIELQSDTNIELNSVSFDVDFPITIKKDNKISKIENFKVIIDKVPLSSIHKVSKEIATLQLQESTSVCLSCLYKLAEENNLYIDIIQYQNNSLIFNIRDYNITEDNIIKSPYNYTFAVKLEDISCNNFIGTEDQFFIQKCVDELIKNSTKEIQIEDVPDLQISVNETFYYKINVNGSKLAFYDYSELFDITNNGVIIFIPNLEQIGNHSVWISVKDILGNEKFKNFNIEVLK